MAYSSSPRHGSKQAVVDLDNLLHCLTRNPVTGSGSGVCGDDDATLKPECQRRRAVRQLYRAVGIGVVIGHGTEE